MPTLPELLADEYRSHHFWACGFHATDGDAAALIRQPIDFRESTSEGDWLGRGIYFWQDAPHWPWEWLDQKADRNSDFRQRLQQHGKAVIGVLIDLADCLDLLDTYWNDVISSSVDSAHTRLADLKKALGQPMPTQDWDPEAPRWNPLDSALINFVTEDLAEELRIPFTAVRCPFIEGTPFFRGSALWTKAHVAISLREPTAIKAMWQEAPPDSLRHHGASV